MGKRKTIMLLVTYKCNLHCSYCYEPKVNSFRMDADRAKCIIKEQMASLDDGYDSVEIQFMGGEPLLEFPLIKEVSEWLWSTPMEKRLVVLFAPTNGTLISDEMKCWFAANKERIHLGLSFDGDMEMQDINRSASFSHVDLDYFVTTWPDQSVKMTVSPETVGCLSKGVEFLHDRGFKYISADLAMGLSVGWTKNSLRVFRTEIGKLVDFYIERPELIPFSMLRLDILSVRNSKNRNGKTCSCGEDMVCVDWTGKTYACHLFSPVAVPVAKALEGNMRYDFKNHSQFTEGQCSKCVLNAICNHCYGMNYICSDDVSKPSPFSCSAFKLLFVANCRFRLSLAKKNGEDILEHKIHEVIRAIV